jgi:hypothetical protein
MVADGRRKLAEGLSKDADEAVREAALATIELVDHPPAPRPPRVKTGDTASKPTTLPATPGGPATAPTSGPAVPGPAAGGAAGPAIPDAGPAGGGGAVPIK